MDRQQNTFWKRKLMALLHDSPDKCFNIQGHEALAESFQIGAGFADESERKQVAAEAKPADWFASSAERFVFPKIKCATTFTGQPGETFLHPLASLPFVIAGDARGGSAQIHELLKAAVSGIAEEDWRKRHFLYWRRWLENAAASDNRYAQALAFLPADTRIPDHSIWNHMAVTSALAGCIESGEVRPALLLFQMGPVQDFIAQARSTRDLWSGSYLLSWLMGHALKAVSERVGPDALIFPNVRGNGIFDALHRVEMYAAEYADGKGGSDRLWDRMLREKGGDEAARWLLTPTLPNRFLAVVPAGQAEALARGAEEAVRRELRAIGEAVWRWVSSNGGRSDWKARWDAQLDAFPQFAWAVQPWLDREACLAEADALPDEKVASRLRATLALAENELPDKDSRYYCGDKLRNPGLLWSAHYALVDARLAARRNTRDFGAWDIGGGGGAVKDSLSGKEECVGDEAFWKGLSERYDKLFPASHRYGAVNLIKRVWCRSDLTPYLRERLGLAEREFGTALRFDSVQEVAQHNTEPRNPYVAVLALDGDEMGQWVSGARTPAFLKQVSKAARAYLEPLLQKAGKAELRRLLTPSYHLQFSEALANFATHVAALVVEAHDGELIYAGGDDVLALLPATRALACAEALRALFRGEPPAGQSRYRLAVVQPGFVSAGTGIPLVMPGPEADVSVGLAVGHQNAPLQSLVREARNAERRAKNTYGRGALAVSLYKRSGEIIEWGCKWDDASGRVALGLMRRLTDAAKGDQLSGRFPYVLAGLLKPYALRGSKPELMPVIQAEIRHSLERQGAGLAANERDALAGMIDAYLGQTADRLEDFINLFLTETFINRSRGED